MAKVGMATKKYPIGTPIKYIGYCRNCSDKTGVIVGVMETIVRINLPESKCYAMKNGSVVCSWSDIVPIIVKNQQLLFSFMD